MATHQSNARAPIRTAQQQVEDKIVFAKGLQDEQKRRDELTALQRDHDAAVAKGVLPSALPRLTPDMSRNDIANAAQKIGFLSGGKSDADPFGSQATGNAAQTARGGAFRGSTPDEIKDFFDSDPINGTAAKETAARVAAQAGTGNQVDTPYGKVSSTNAKLGPGATWQDQVVNRYPEIGQAGTDANKAFTAAYNSAIRQTGPNADGTPAGKVDPHAIADQVMNQLAKTGPNSDLETPDLPVGTPAKPPAPPVPAAMAAGQAVKNAPAAASNALVNAGGAIKNTVGAVGDAVDNFEAGLTGKTLEQVRGGPTPQSPDESVPAPTADELATAKAKARAGAADAYAKAGVPPPVRTNGAQPEAPDEQADAFSNPAVPAKTLPASTAPATAPAAPAQPAVTPTTARPDDPHFASVDGDLQKAQGTQSARNADPTDDFAAQGQHMIDNGLTGPVSGNLQAAKGNQSSLNANPDDDFAAFAKPAAAPVGDTAAAGGRNNTAGDDNLSTFAKNPEEDEFQNRLNNQEAA